MYQTNMIVFDDFFLGDNAAATSTTSGKSWITYLEHVYNCVSISMCVFDDFVLGNNAVATSVSLKDFR